VRSPQGQMSSLVILKATAPEHFAQGRALFEDYQRWLAVDLSFQNFSAELESIATMYGPPSGVLLVAKSGDLYAGCVGIRPLEGRCAEMKRMYVPEAFRGRGIGRALAEASVSAARELGYAAVRLDTVPRLEAALAIYRSLGFVEIGAYRYNPHSDALFLELKL